MIFLPFADFKRATKQNFIYKLSNDDKILPSLITKMCPTFTFLNHMREIN